MCAVNSQTPEPVRNPPAFVAIGLAVAAAIALAGLFKADWDVETSFFAALVAAAGALVIAAGAVGWSLARRGRGWVAAAVAALVSAAALGWVAWTFLLLVRASA
jgi:hypothetical protein